MRCKHSDSIPRYQQIALEVAKRIVNGEYAEGDRISGRSSIASQYNVSPETARRAFCILADMEIVSAEKGSGMHILSRKKAAIFIRQFSSQRDISTIKGEIFRNIEHQKENMEQLNATLTDLIQATEHYRSLNPLAPFSIKITAACKYLEKTVEEIRLWQHTGATIVAIKRDDALILSPGPYAVLKENDILYYIPQDFSEQKLQEYLYDEASHQKATANENNLK